MPLREYHCPQCERSFECLVRTSDAPPKCTHCGSSNLELKYSRFATSNTAIHKSERPIIFRNPRTGEMRFPPRDDAPLHPKYAAQGFERVEAFTTFGERDAFEKSTGRVHERTHYDPGSASAERDLAPPDNSREVEQMKQLDGQVPLAAILSGL